MWSCSEEMASDLNLMDLGCLFLPKSSLANNHVLNPSLGLLSLFACSLNYSVTKLFKASSIKKQVGHLNFRLVRSLSVTRLFWAGLLQVRICTPKLVHVIFFSVAGVFLGALDFKNFKCMPQFIWKARAWHRILIQSCHSVFN